MFLLKGTIVFGVDDFCFVPEALKFGCGVRKSTCLQGRKR